MGILRHNLARLRTLTGTSRLSAKQAELLGQMRSDNRASSGHYKPSSGPGWAQLSREFNDLFHTEGIGDVESQQYNSRFSSFPPRNKVYYTLAAFQLYRQLKDADQYGVFDRLLKTQAPASADHILEFDDIRLSWDLLLSLQNLMAIAEGQPEILERPVTVLDLGAGWGRIGHVLLRVNPRATYIAADLPETLLIAESYLPKTLPGIPAYGYAAHQHSISRSSLLSEPGIHFVGSHMFPKFEDRSIDIFINVASFQEMSDAQVAGYFEDIERLTSSALYLLQQSTPNTKGGLMGDYPVREAWHRKFRRPCWHIPEYFEALYQISAA